MLKREEKALRELAEKLRIPEAMPYSSHPDLEDGCDQGRENAADELTWLLDELLKEKK